MTVRAARETHGFVVGVTEMRPLPGSHGPDPGHRDLRGLGRRLERADALGRDRAQDLVVVASGQHRFHHGGLLRQRLPRGLRQRHARNLDVGRHPGGAAQLAKVADEPVRHVHGAEAWARSTAAIALRGCGRR